jgi:hypothetical protein
MCVTEEPEKIRWPGPEMGCCAKDEKCNLSMSLNELCLLSHTVSKVEFG